MFADPCFIICFVCFGFCSMMFICNYWNRRSRTDKAIIITVFPGNLSIYSHHDTRLCCCSAAQTCLTFETPWTTACQAPLPSSLSQSLLKVLSMESVVPSNHLTLYHPLLLLPSVFPSIRVFSTELAFCIRWPNYWSFSFSISPSHEYSGLISFGMDWFDLQFICLILKLATFFYPLTCFIALFSSRRWNSGAEKFPDLWDAVFPLLLACGKHHKTAAEKWMNRGTE